MSRRRQMLGALGLDRPELRAWVLYDWANSAFMTSVVAAIFPIHFATVLARELEPGVATRRLALLTAATLGAIALSTPVLGAMADHAGWRKRSLAAFLVLGAAATAALALVDPGDWRLGAFLFAVANVGAYGSFVFYDSLLPHLAGDHEVDRVSTTGYSVGYLGGGVLLIAHLAWLRHPGAFGLAGPESAAHLAFVTTALWWVTFSVPLFRSVREPTPNGVAAATAPPGGVARDGLRRLGRTFRELPRYPETFLFLLAFVVYADGIATIIRLAAAYGSELGIAADALVAAIVVVQLVGVPSTLLFGRLAARIGPKRAIFMGLAAYGAICVIGYGMRGPAGFFTLAVIVGMVQGGTQALSRSLFATLIPRRSSSQFFAFFAVAERFAGVAGPLIFAGVGRATGSNRYAVLALVVLFAVGGALLARVDVDAGRRRDRG